MSIGDKSKVMEVLNKAHAGTVVDKYTASAAIREFEGILDDLYVAPPKYDMVSMHKNEIEKMREMIKYQDQKIKDLSGRVHIPSPSLWTSSYLPVVGDQLDLQRRYELADRFTALYNNEWMAAYEELKSTMKWRDIDCIYALMRIVRNACDLCLTLALDQMDRLLVNAEDVMFDPVGGKGGKFKKDFENSNGVYTDGMKKAEQYVKVYRKERAEASVPAVIELFIDAKLRAIISPYDVKLNFKNYIRKCVELVWLMTTLDPPVRLFWQQQTERVNEDFFNHYDLRGEFVNQTVWPAIFLHSTGVLLYKGKILSM